MRIGLLADIHEDVAGLEAAIACCKREGVDRLITLGDIFHSGERFADTVELLREAKVEGVWGNHEFALYAGRGESVLGYFDWRTLDYMRFLKARYEIGDLLFSHVLPCIDPTDIEQPWYVERAPQTAEDAARNFSAFPHRRIFVGHFHEWLAVTPGGALDWNGEQAFSLEKTERYLFVVGAVCDGWCAIYDADADLLEPFRIGAGKRRLMAVARARSA